jgi:hypothetical protein
MSVAGYDQGGGYLNSPNVGGSQQQQKVSVHHLMHAFNL